MESRNKEQSEELTEQELDQVAGGTDNNGAFATTQATTNKAITGNRAAALNEQYIRG
jgi:bacteriocin-like protein